MHELERIPPEEAAQIAHVVDLTLQQLRRRYPGETPTLRGVHPKSHGCVKAKLTVRADLHESLRVGVFAEPGRAYDAWVRYSNAAVTVTPDSPLDPASGVNAHGSRGMAVKLVGVTGTPLLPTTGPLTQDFLLITQPMFAFANVEDYEVVSRVLEEHNDDARPFFAERIKKKDDGSPDLSDPATARAVRTFQIVNRVRSLSVEKGAFAPPPATPVDVRYFSAAPFLFGNDRVAKFAARPTAPAADPPDLADDDYLKNGLVRRLAAGAAPVEFEFQVQLRQACELADKVEAEIENASHEWPEQVFPFVTLGTLVIPPQEFDTPENRAHCEKLFFTPWHGVAEHRPLGGINRLRRKVYEASALFRNLPKKPAAV